MAGLAAAAISVPFLLPLDPALAPPVAVAQVEAPRPDCTACHTCPNPSRDQPCLKACPRHQQPAALSPASGPDIVILDDLEDLYVPVRFDHKTHAGMSGMSKGCETCHHFTPPNSPHPACKDCHPVEIVHEDLAQPGLKGAYHRRCLSCHAAWDKDTACEICHERKKGGRLGGTATEVCEHSHYAPVKLKELILFSTSFAPKDSVPFHHRNHSQLYERDCTECHRRQSCTRCHVQGSDELHPMGNPTEVSLHDTCFRCHDGTRCAACHGRDPGALFTHAETGWPLKAYHAALPCRTCHGPTGAFRKLDPRCATCHPNGWPAASFDHRVTGVALDEVHREAGCETCHAGGPGSRPRCDSCHDDGRTYNRSRGFRAG
ncbi:MAG: cytochrome c3 family protein [Acidobacteriota bacterium]